MRVYVISAFWVTLVACVVLIDADVSHIVTTTPPPGPPKPYIFSYQAGRAEGHVDRQHTEVSDGTGVIRGAFSYVDPKNQVRTVQYVADENGFHPQLSHQVEDTAAVKLAKQKHHDLYNRIAEEQSNPQQQQHTLQAAALNYGGPAQSEAVVRATNKHLSLYERIAAEHAAIGAQQEAERLAFEATSEHSPADASQHYRY